MKLKRIILLLFLVLLFISNIVFADNTIENIIANNQIIDDGIENNNIINNTFSDEDTIIGNSMNVTNDINANTMQSNNVNNQDENVLETNEINSIDQEEIIEINQISTYVTRTVAVSTEQMLKSYLERDDGNTYEIYLSNDITVTSSIAQHGTKNIHGYGHTIYGNVREDELSVIHFYGTASIENTNFNANGVNVHNVAARNGCHLTVSNSSFYNGAQGIHVDTTSELVVDSAIIYGNALGIGNLGTITVNNAIIYNNNQGIHNNGGTVTINNAEIYDNMWGVLNTNSCTMNGGYIHDNEIGIHNSLNDAHLTINDGYICENQVGIRNTETIYIENVTFEGNDECAVFHIGVSCTITGGTFNENQVVYLADDDKYVTTNSSYPIFEVKPNSYTNGRVVIKTNSNDCANTEITKASLTPNLNWILKVSSSDIVIWKKGSVVVKYVDQDNKEIADAVTIDGYVDDDYTTTSIPIKGYNLSAIPTNSTGKYTESTITVIYKYTLKDTKVVVNYKDQNGNILETKTIIGKVFDDYEVSSKEIYGYKLVTNASNSKGTMTEDTITVNFIYQKIYGNIKVTIVDRDNASIKIKGAEVTLYNSSGTAISTKTTDVNGQVNFTDLEVGQFKVGQTKATENYSLADKEISAEINNSNTNFDLKLLNYKKVELPKTGGQSLLFIIIGAIFISISLLIYKLKKKKGEKNYDK